MAEDKCCVTYRTITVNGKLDGASSSTVDSVSMTQKQILSSMAIWPKFPN